MSVTPFAAWAAVRLGGAERGFPAVQLLAFTPYVAAASAVPLAAAVASRRGPQSLAALVAAAALGACVLPRAVGAPEEASAPAASRPPSALAAGPLHGAGPSGTGGVPYRVMTSNLLIGAADPRDVVRQVRERGVDLLAVQELTPDAVDGLRAAGIDGVLPYGELHPRPGGSGSGLWSRFPLSGTGVRDLPHGNAQARAVVHVPGASPVRVESAHPEAPLDEPGASAWEEEIALQPRAHATAAPDLLLGDFNSTLDHAGLRALVATGYRDAAATTGAGLEPTWPAVPVRVVLGLRVPGVTLDHVLAGPRIGVRSAAVHPVAGSDHRAVVADVVLPPSGRPPLS